MGKLHKLEMKRNSAIWMLKQMRSEGAYPVHIGQQKKVIRDIEAEISILKDGNVEYKNLVRYELVFI